MRTPTQASRPVALGLAAALALLSLLALPEQAVAVGSSGVLSSVSQAFKVRNGAARDAAIDAVGGYMDANFAGARSELSRRYLVEETGTIDASVINGGANVAAEVEAAIAQVRCGGPFSASLCETTITDIPADEGRIAFSIKMNVTEAQQSTIASNAEHLDDPGAFVVALGPLLDPATDLTNVTTTLETANVEATVYVADSGAEDPLTEAVFDEVRDAAALLDAAIANALSAHGTGGDSKVGTFEIDYCNWRTCNGKGVCDPDTGICACPDPDGAGAYWWGVQCATECTCENGGECVAGMCQCPHPHFGLRCDQERDCGCGAPAA